MLDIYDYLIGWAVYIAAGTLCFTIFYRATGGLRFKPLANILRAVLLAVMFTPWYISPEEELLAPAIIVMTLDLVTVGGTSFVRALVPLVLAVIILIPITLAGRVVQKRIADSREKSL